MKKLLLRFHHNFIVEAIIGYSSSGLTKFIYFITIIGFITIGDYVFEYGFLDSIYNFLDIFFKEKVAYTIFFFLMLFIVGGMIYTPFFIYALIKAIISKKK